MKKQTLFGLIILSIFVWSCGNTTSEKNNSDKAEKKIVLDTKESMLAKLNEYKINIPEEMTFRSVDMQVYLNKDFEEDTSHIIYFDMKDIDESKESELSQWYDNQLKTLTDDGWNVNKEVKDKEMISGGIYNNCILMKESENCTLSIGISFNGEGGSTINVAPRYEIR